MAAGRSKSRFDELDEKALARLRAAAAARAEKKRRKVRARPEEMKKAARAAYYASLPFRRAVGGLCSFVKARSGEVPEEVISGVVVPALKACGPLAGMSILLGVMMGSPKYPLLVIGILAIFLAVVIGVRLLYARVDCRAYYGVVTDWKHDDMIAGAVARWLSFDETAFRRAAMREKEAWRKNGITYYMIQIEGEKKPYRVPVTRTNDPLPIGTIVRVQASRNTAEGKKERYFQRVYTVVDLDLEAFMEDVGPGFLPGADPPKLVYVRDPSLPTKEEAIDSFLEGQEDTFMLGDGGEG